MTITPQQPDRTATAADRRLDGGGCDALHCVATRNHFLNATLSVLGLNAALVSLWFVGQNGRWTSRR
ncbi:hypothetical protein LNQ03_27050 [Klebsiella pneumoniae subsp. pneumoniae]|nr:hypothetical protein [Klebsiella pneumoniae subsp. pneumoniae]